MEQKAKLPGFSKKHSVSRKAEEKLYSEIVCPGNIFPPDDIQVHFCERLFDVMEKAKGLFGGVRKLELMLW